MSAPGATDVEPSAAEDSSPSGWRVGSAFGVPVYARPSALVFAAVLAVLSAPVARAQFPGVGALGLVIALTVPALMGVCVLGHELGHLLAGRLAGIPATRITLDILGGETEFDREAPTAGRGPLPQWPGPRPC